MCLARSVYYFLHERFSFSVIFFSFFFSFFFFLVCIVLRLKFLKLSKEVLITVKRFYGHEVRERIVVMIMAGYERGDYSHIMDPVFVYVGEEWMVKNAASGSFLNTNTPTKKIQ